MNAKILVVDIETSPQIGYFWGKKWETNIIEVSSQSAILSFSAKWLNGKHITKGICDYAGYKKGVIDDLKLVKEISNLLDEADIVVLQNGRAFDIKTINSRLLYHNLPPPSPYKTVDTLLEARRYLKLPSYSLDDMCAYFGIGRKQEHEGFPLWKKCIAGDKAAWKQMLKYNKHDVTLTEELYLKLRPLMKSHPNMGQYVGLSCPKCGSKNLQSRGYAVTLTGKYKRLACQTCGGWSRTKENEIKIKTHVSL